MKHFRLYMIEERNGVKQYDDGEFLTSARCEALVYEGNENYAADVAGSYYQVEWCNEDEEMVMLNAPRLPGL